MRWINQRVNRQVNRWVTSKDETKADVSEHVGGRTMASDMDASERIAWTRLAHRRKIGSRKGKGKGRGTSEGGGDTRKERMRAMVLDVVEEKGHFYVWGLAEQGRRVCWQVQDYCPYFYLHAPVYREKTSRKNEGRWIDEEDCQAFWTALQERTGTGCTVRQVRIVHKKPLMFYRPNSPESEPFLWIQLEPGESTRKASAACRTLLRGDFLKSRGLILTESAIYEDEIKPLTRFMCDVNISAGKWISCPFPRGNTRVPHAQVPWEEICSTDDELDHPEPTIVSFRTLVVDCFLCSATCQDKTPQPATDPIGWIACYETEMEIDGASYEKHGGKLHIFGWRQLHPLKEATAHCYKSEKAMLEGWCAWVKSEADPDLLLTFQVRDTFQTILKRSKSLKMDGLALGRDNTFLKCQSSVMYSASWVRSQSRMSATSNQETFKASVGGRLVIDVLRHVLTNQSLSTFTLADCVQSILGETLEVLPSSKLALLWQGTANERQRLVRYTQRRLESTLALAKTMGTLSESMEMARVAGLTIPQVLYNAQLVRTFSLLLRFAHQQNYILGGKLEAGALSESPYLMHPSEHKTAGFYRDPIAVLDFASLYPSIYQAHNLCYTTLLHPDDRSTLKREEMFITPTGAAFVSTNMRRGLLPDILDRLVQARDCAKTTLSKLDPSSPAFGRMNSRQKALKITANALYGFTGASASPLQCVPLADSCLALGSAACQKAKWLLEESESSESSSSKVIYCQTDSIFLRYPGMKTEDAIRAGQKAADIVSREFQAPIRLKFERVMHPFLLLHVNRYAGKAFEKVGDTGHLAIKGIRSEWRQSPPFLQNILRNSLEYAIMMQDIQMAVHFAKSEIQRLLLEKCSLHELIMTGGLWRISGKEIETAAGNRGDGSDITGPHATLAVKMLRRDSGRMFSLGERIPYILLDGYTTQEDAAEDPLVVLQASGLPNYALYWNNKVRSFLHEIFQHLLNAKDLEDLLEGSHTRIRHTRFPKDSTRNDASPNSKRKRQQGLGKYFQQKYKCLKCGQAIQAGTSSLCRKCAKEPGLEAQILQGLLQDRKSAELKFQGICEKCLRCDSSLLSQPFLCQNGDCKFLYLRGRVAVDMEDLDRAIARFDLQDPA